MTEDRSLVRRNAALFAFATAFALGSCSLEIVAHALGAAGVASPLDASVVRAGALLRLPVAFGLGLLLALPFGLAAEKGTPIPRAVGVSGVLGALFLAAGAVCWFHLGRTGVLPHRMASDAAALTSSAPAVGVALVLAGAVPFLAIRLFTFASKRVENPASIAADAIVVALAAIITTGAIFAGTRALFFGAMPPLLQYVLAVTPSADPAPEASGHGHGHGNGHDHEHDHDGGHAHDHARQTPEAPTFPPDPPAPDGQRRPGPEVRYLLSTGLGIESLPVEVDPSYPFCRTTAKPTSAPTPRAVLLVVLEGVGQREVASMPSLRRIAAAGIPFDHALATSDDAAQGLVSVLSGTAAQTSVRFGDVATLPGLPSLPRTLAGVGIPSAFFSGRDLARGLTGRYVASLGFDRVVDAELQALLDHRNDDAGAIARFRAFVDESRPSGPVFATLVLAGATLAAADDAAGTAVNLRALDTRLGEIFTWYEQTERARGTVLVVTAASASQVPSRPEPRTSPLSRARFEVPLVIVGNGLAEGRVADVQHRVSATYDIPQTVLGTLGIGATGCFMGRDVLGASEWPDNRLVVATAGPAQNYNYVHWETNRWQTAITQPPYAWQVVDLAGDPTLSVNKVAELGVTHEDMQTFHASFRAVSEYMLIRDRYVPSADVTRPAATALAAAPRLSVFAVTGAPSSLLPDVTGSYLAPIQQVEGGVLAVESTSPPRPLDNLLVEVGTNRIVIDVRGMQTPTRALLLVEALRNATRGGPRVVLAEDPHVLFTVASRTDAETWVESPATLDVDTAARSARELGIDGIVRQASEIDAAFVERAHALGVRVIARGAPAGYDVPVDVVITSDVEVARAFARAPASARP